MTEDEAAIRIRNLEKSVRVFGFVTIAGFFLVGAVMVMAFVFLPRSGGDITAQGGTGIETLNIDGGKSEADRILEGNPETLTTYELSVIEGVNTDTIRRRIIETPDGAFYVQKDGKRWAAAKGTGGQWFIKNPRQE